MDYVGPITVAERCLHDIEGNQSAQQQDCVFSAAHGQARLEARGTVVALTSIEPTYYCSRWRSLSIVIQVLGPYYSSFTLHSWLSGVPLYLSSSGCHVP